MPRKTHIYNYINCVLYRFIKFLTEVFILFLSKFKAEKAQKFFIQGNGSNVLTNFLCLAFFNGLGGILLILTQIKIANYIGPSEYGIFSYCIAIGEIGAMFVRYGRDKSLVRELLTVEDSDSQNNLIITTFLVGIINFLIFILIILSFHTPLHIKIDITSLLLVASACIISLDFQPVYESRQMMGWHSIYNFLQKLIFIGTMWTIMLVHRPLSLFIISFVLTISWIIILVFQFFEIRNICGIKFCSHKYTKHIIRHYKTGIYLALCSFIAAAFSPLIRMMVKLMSNDTDLGIFSAGLQLYGISMFFLMQIARIGYPKLAIMAKENVNYNKTINFLWKYTLLMIVAISPFSLLMLSFPEFIAYKLFAPEYSSVSSILPYLGIVLFEYAITIVLMQFLIAFRQDKYYLLGQVFGAITIILLGFYLIPKRPLIGGVCSLLFSYIIIILIYGVKLYKMSYFKEKSPER